MQIEAHKITAEELQQVNRFTLRELAENEVYIFTAKFIDSEPTSNGRIWSQEWMEQAVQRGLFQGVPFLTNHENDQTQKIGTVFSAELREDGIYGKVYIPLDEQGKQAREAIENGRIKNVSINADGEPKQEQDKIRILPSDNMRVYEVSAVAVGGCATCTTINEHCQPSGTTEGNAARTELLEFAAEQLQRMEKKFVRAAGLTLGTNNRELLERVAKELAPNTLIELSDELRQLAEPVGTTVGADANAAPTSAALEALQLIRKTKGA